jgi:5-methylthioadenosine/S-adenosylhomocysteine deaminase
VREEVQQRAEEVAAAVKRDPVHLDMALLQAMEEGKL